MLINAPPEFPGFTAASVCMYDCVVLPVGSKFRDFAEIIPAVTVDVRLKGLPTAKTHSPIFVESLSPNTAYSKSVSEFIFSSAISFCSSLPITSAIYDWLSFVVISIWSEFSITWWFVTIYPSEEIITPDPLPILGLIWDLPNKKSSILKSSLDDDELLTCTTVLIAFFAISTKLFSVFSRKEKLLLPVFFNVLKNSLLWMSLLYSLTVLITLWFMYKWATTNNPIKKNDSMDILKNFIIIL